MITAVPRSAIVAFGVLLTPIAALIAMRAFPSLDPTYVKLSFHFWAVTLTSIAAAVAAIVIVVTSRSVRETRLLFLALAFLSIAVVFSIHGLNTPGYIDHPYHLSLIRVSAWITIAAAALFVSLSAIEMPHRLEEIVEERGIMVFAWIVVALGVYVTLSLSVPGWLEWVPTDNTIAHHGSSIVISAMLIFCIWRYGQAYLFARLPAQAAMVATVTLLLDTELAMFWNAGEFHLSWWMYHALYLAAFTVLFAGWAVEAVRARSLNAIADALSLRDALAQLERGHDEYIVKLVDAIETKDRATLGHVRRVSSYAYGIGKVMGLSQSELRDLALAAQMHDVGKIGVPDAVLLKPGKLTDEEFTEIKRHAPRGFDIAQRVKALRDLAPVIRAHHERLNGRGYPDGLAGDEIPLLSRIIAVADTYDAITSNRPYRGGAEEAAAIAELRRCSGTEFEPRCVEALVTYLAAQQSQAA